MKKPTSDEIAAYLEALVSGNAKPRDGLPDAIFRFALEIVPMINVDLLIKDDRNRTLVAWRQDEFGEGWHIPGGIIRRGECIEDRIAAVAFLELGAEVKADIFACRICQLPNTQRGHFISLLYRCVLQTPVPSHAFAAQNQRAYAGQLFWAGDEPAPIYPHAENYRDLIAPKPNYL